MRILAIDTSGRTLGVAVTEGETVLCAHTRSALDGGGWKHSQALLPVIDEMLTSSNIALTSVDCVAYTCGPGSFTGLRIGAATALGIARGAGIPAVAVPTTDAMAYTGIITDKLPRVTAMLDARRGQVYAAVYEGEARNGTMRIKRITDYLADTEANIRETTPAAAVIRDTVSPAAVALQAYRQITDSPFEKESTNSPPALLYVRAPQAVREKQESSPMAAAGKP